MRIAFVILTLNGHSGARAPIKIAEHLFKLGENITIYASILNLDHNLREDLERKGLRVKIITPLSLLRLLRKNRPELISFHSTLLYQAMCFLSRIPIIKTYYGSQLVSMNLEEENTIGLKRAVWERFLLKLADKIIFLIEKISFLLAHKTIGISKSTALEAKHYFGKKIDYILLGSDFTEEVLKSGRSIDEEEIKIISVSRIVPYKGFHHLIEAFKKADIPLSKLFIIGTSPKKDYLDYLKKISDERVEIILNPEDKKLREFYQQCSFYASATRWEGFGMPFLEAGFFGKPSVGFFNTSLPEVVKHGKTGFLAENQVEFTQYLKRLAGDKKLRDTLGRKAKEQAESFTWDKTALEYKRAFQEILNFI